MFRIELLFMHHHLPFLLRFAIPHHIPHHHTLPHPILLQCPDPPHLLRHRRRLGVCRPHRRHQHTLRRLKCSQCLVQRATAPTTTTTITTAATATAFHTAMSRTTSDTSLHRRYNDDPGVEHAAWLENRFLVLWCTAGWEQRGTAGAVSFTACWLQLQEEEDKEISGASLGTVDGSQRQVSQVSLCAPSPALYSLSACLSTQAEADRMHDLCSVHLGHVCAQTVRLTIRNSLSALTATRITNLKILARHAEIGHVTLHDVHHVIWYTKQQRTIRGHLDNVHLVELGNNTSVMDVGALARVSAITLSCCNSNRVDLAPLQTVQALAINGGHVINSEAPIETARIVDLQNIQLRTTTLSATHVKLSSMVAVPDVLHLPNATHIVLDMESKVSRFTSPSHVKRLVIGDATPNALPRLLDFEHADVVVLRLPQTTLPRSFLADVGRRADRLILCYCVRGVTDLCVVPDSVHVCVERASVDGPVPGCVRKLHARVEGELRCAWLGSALQWLTLHGTGVRPLHDVHLLSGRKYLRIMYCPLFGQLSNCQNLHLYACCGALALTSINTLQIERVALTTGPPSSCCADDGDTRGSDNNLSITNCHDVFKCKLRECEITDFAFFQGVHTLVLKNCTFDTLDSLPNIGCLVLRNCASSNRQWLWPDVALSKRSHHTMIRVLLAGKRKSNR
ncbi:hypothetical protein PTSG_05419 [Salpingoeca rosetta]|uniref:Uncharacterized protein n=1 Tax=Salpingoeca rosetta (strain ATCC 50818 / BSB-021) TaxID=946362 RepID=F2UAD7_SALR5|nr:uncharacterized protein PTSG_05419 [Salpingoeca rosetta]EGD73712.1 hypothetical protein PTSG_05419 [Salpingoeca rosetta]|eukprot:XP_004993993.1 hypothetical protein PTSG_05419 [Salpingoeca rosetta]